MTPCRAARHYTQKVRRCLFCSKLSRERIMKTVQNAVDAYLTDEQTVTYHDLTHALGEPKAFAESLLANVPAAEIESSRKRQSLRFRAIVIALATFATMLVIALGMFYVKYQNAMRNDCIINETLVVYPDDMTDEEFEKFMDYTADSVDSKRKTIEGDS